jgi:hypothetical protein
MFLIRWQNLFHYPTFLAHSSSRLTPRSIQPGVERLEDRLAPTTTTITNISSVYGLGSQSETVNVSVTDPSTKTVNSGQVAITDAGQTHIVNVGNGTATSTFTFGLFQEQPLPHTVTANFTDPSGVLNSSSASSTAPNTYSSYLLQLYIDFYLLAAYNSFVAGSSSGSSSGSGSGSN